MQSYRWHPSLSSVSLEKFKAFSSNTVIPIAPITMLFGDNSAGKSSIIQALKLTKQTIEGDHESALVLRGRNALSDLGNFSDVLTDRNCQNKLKLGFEFSPNPHSLGDQFPFSQDLFSWIGLGFEIGYSSEREVEFSGFTLSSGKSPEHLLPFLKWRKHQDIWLTASSEYWHDSYTKALNRRRHIARGLAALIKRVEGKPAIRFSKNTPEYFVDSLTSLRAAWRFYSSDFTERAFIKRTLFDLSKSEISIESFFGYMDRDSPIALALRNARRPAGSARRTGAVRACRGFGTVLPENDWGKINSPLIRQARISELVDASISEFCNIFKNYIPLSSNRNPPSRWYTYAGDRPDNVGYEGERMPDVLYKYPDVVEEVNKWLDRLSIKYQMKVRRSSVKTDDLYSLLFRYTGSRHSAYVSLADIGYGVSQILPFIVQCVLGVNNIISIEQPEVHIHPRLQADLGDLLAETTNPEKQGNMYIIETHSEHLVLRMQKLIRNGKLKPEDVSIIYVERTPTGSKANRLKLDEKGDFIAPWPRGFFNERLRELE